MPTLRDYDDIERDLQGLSLAVPQELQAAADRDRVAGINQGVTDVVRTAGLGLARGFDTVGNAVSQGLDAITPSQDTLYRVFAGLEAAGAAGRGQTPLWLQRQGQQQELQMRRQQLAQQLQQQEEQKRQFNWQEMLRIDKEFANDPERWQMAMASLAKDRGFVPAQHLLSVGDKKMMGELESSLPFIERYYPEFAQKYQQDPRSVSKSEVASVLGNIKKLKERRAASDADSQELAALEKAYDAYLGGDKGALGPGDAERLIELKNAREKQQLQLEELRLKNKKLAREAEGKDEKPDHSVLNRVHQALNQGQSWDEGNPESQQSALLRYSQLYAQGRKDVELSAPVDKQAPVYRHPVTGRQASPVRSATELLGRGYVTVRPDQVGTLNQLELVESALQDIKDLGNKVLREATGHTFLDAPAGVMQKGVMGIKKSLAGNPDLERLESALQRIQAPMNRLQGDTANIAVAEREMLAKAVFKDTDTVQSLYAKIKDIDRSLKSVKKQMGFLSREDYVRKWVKEGKTEEQIQQLLRDLMRED